MVYHVTPFSHLHLLIPFKIIPSKYIKPVYGKVSSGTHMGILSLTISMKIFGIVGLVLGSLS